jgi:hypothetical protein
MFDVSYADTVEASSTQAGGRHRSASKALTVSKTYANRHDLVILSRVTGEDSRGDYTFSVVAVWEYGERIR